jgi:Icc-related predicted phosphoesterase
MRIVAISDTHGMHDRIDVPEGDVLVHAGDFTSNGKASAVRAFADWLDDLPHAHKVVIAGNHERSLELDPELGPRLFRRATYLFDSETEIAGLTFHGSPWQPWFLDWAFNLPRGEPLRRKWAMIGPAVDVLVTHGPPMGVLDRTTSGERAGCEELAMAIGRVQPTLHLFGHIHEGHGCERVGDTLHVNASICTVGYAPTNPPFVIDVTQSGAEVVAGHV